MNNAHNNGPENVLTETDPSHSFCNINANVLAYSYNYRLHLVSFLSV